MSDVSDSVSNKNLGPLYSLGRSLTIQKDLLREHSCRPGLTDFLSIEGRAKSLDYIVLD